MTGVRQARVRALAKINLDLRVLGKRQDGYHELRTIFQTVSLSDHIEITFARSRKTQVEAVSSVPIAGNIAVRAAHLCLDEMRIGAHVGISIAKRIPMGAGLGGGSSDAAAVLLTLPVLAGKPVALERLLALARSLGSDVPFFLLGGRAAGLGRGEELYPLPDHPARHALVVAPGIHVSTAGAYKALNAPSLASSGLTTDRLQTTIERFVSLAWDAGRNEPVNDFEPAVFAEHPALRAVKRRLKRLGAVPALLSGSGSALYGVFGSQEAVQQARQHFDGATALPVTFVGRARYRALWRRWLRPFAVDTVWPPRNSGRNAP